MVSISKEIEEKTFRSRMYNKGVILQSNEMQRSDYLPKLSSSERHNLVRLMKNIRTIQSRKVESINYSLLAVGTTTYPDEYWHNLEKYLEEQKDTKLQKYAQNKGQDIDLIICDEWLYDSCRMLEFMNLLEKNQEKFEAKFRVETNGTEFGTSYLNVPKEHQKEIGNSVIRVKSKNYCGDSFILNYENSRSFHLSFETLYATEVKIRMERTDTNIPFSVLLRDSDIKDLELAILWGERTGIYENLTPNIVEFWETRRLIENLKSGASLDKYFK
ncbi:hypothetical protein J4404_00320 [Candidatus Woesearchaeota archaeon]|nr:hypothetical protein [Candidatus Woesearchaeota archaeon]